MLALLQQHNKPFNIQNVSDFLATQGVKKTAAQKALDALAERGDILVKVGAEWRMGTWVGAWAHMWRHAVKTPCVRACMGGAQVRF